MTGFMKRLETIFMAAAFAESGEHETAREILNEEKRTEKTDRPEMRIRKDQRPPQVKRWL